MTKSNIPSEQISYNHLYLPKQIIHISQLENKLKEFAGVKITDYDCKSLKEGIIKIKPFILINERHCHKIKHKCLQLIKHKPNYYNELNVIKTMFMQTGGNTSFKEILKLVELEKEYKIDLFIPKKWINLINKYK